MKKAVSVSQVNNYIAKKLRDDHNLKGIAVEGEISGISPRDTYTFITLSDALSQIKCIIWASDIPSIDMGLVENGKKIIALCDINPYPKNGSYSLSIRHVEAVGEGALMAEFNRIKEKLEKEGLFDKKYKKPIPDFPYRVGVVTSPAGAAIKDIHKIIKRKNNYTDILIFPALVQGVGAVDSICENIETANKISDGGHKIDTLIVGRGGGSPEDLAAFNDEKVCRTIFNSKIPVISAVGHESDFSISDMVADARAETPTAAADMAVMNTYDLMNAIETYKEQLVRSSSRKIEAERQLMLSRRDLLMANIKSKIAEANSIIDKSVIMLKENDPRAVFNKGYAAVMHASGEIVPDVASVRSGEEYIIKMRDGSFTANVIDIRKDDTDE